MKLQTKGVKGGKDRRGLISLSYNFLFTDSSEEEALFAKLPVTIGIPEVDRQIVDWVSHTSFMISATFEGITSEFPGEEQDQTSITGEWSNEPIEAFPRPDLLKKMYGAYIDDDGRIKFPEFLDGASTGGSGLGSSRSAKQQEKNPLFGISTYPVQRLVATHSYVRERVPKEVYRRAGTVVKSLPAAFDDPPDDKTWIVDNPGVRKRGNCREILERYKEINDLKHIEALALLLRK